MSIMLALIVFVVLVSTGSITEYNVSESIEYELGELRKRSTVSITMNDKMWRADDIPRDKYAGWPAYKVLSHYFSTPGDTVYIYDDPIPRSEVREDLKSYLNHSMKKYWKEGPSDIDYRLNVTQRTITSERPMEISVGTYSPSARFAKITYPLSLTGGREAEIALFTKTSQNIYSVGGTS
jgi:hypothetical protein